MGIHYSFYCSSYHTVRLPGYLQPTPKTATSLWLVFKAEIAPEPAPRVQTKHHQDWWVFSVQLLPVPLLASILTICLLPPEPQAPWVSCHAFQAFKAPGLGQWPWKDAALSHFSLSAHIDLFQSPQLSVPGLSLFMKHHSKSCCRASSTSITRTWILSHSKAPVKEQ